MTHSTRTFALVLVILFVCTAGLFACASANEAILVNTPEPTPTATATPTPEPTPTPTPVPTTQAEYEEEYSKLGMIDSNRVIPGINLKLIVFKTIDNCYRMAFGISTVNKYDNGGSLYDLFSGEKLFTFDKNSFPAILDKHSVDTVAPYNESLLQATFIRLSTPLNQLLDFPELGIDFPLSRELYDIFAADDEAVFSKQELGDIFLKYIPKEYRMYGVDLIPGNPNMRMTTYPGPTVSPSPNPTSTISPEK